MTNLFDPPTIYTLPLSKGGDLIVDFIYKPLVVDEDGNPVLVSGQRQYAVADYPALSTVTLTVDTDTPVTAEAVINNEHARITVDKAVADTIPKGKLWRVVLALDNGTDVVMCNGVTARSDGK